MLVFVLSANPGGFNGHTKIRKFSQMRTNFLIFLTRKKRRLSIDRLPEKQKRVCNLKKTEQFEL